MLLIGLLLLLHHHFHLVLHVLLLFGRLLAHFVLSDAFFNVVVELLTLLVWELVQIEFQLLFTLLVWHLILLYDRDDASKLG